MTEVVVLVQRCHLCDEVCVGSWYYDDLSPAPLPTADDMEWYSSYRKAVPGEEGWRYSMHAQCVENRRRRIMA